MCKYAVVDLEMCRVPKGDKRKPNVLHREVIQIGAVLMDESFETIGMFETFVRPEYGTVDAFIERLTGISSRDVAAAPAAKQAVKSFFDWLPEDARLVSWSGNDKKQLSTEINAKQIDIPKLSHFMEEWIDCQLTFGEKLSNDRSYKLSEALNMADIDYSEGEHNALTDAKNTALLFAKMSLEPELTLSPYLVRDESPTFYYNPFAALFDKPAFA